MPGCEKSSAQPTLAQAGHARLVLSKAVTFSAQPCTELVYKVTDYIIQLWDTDGMQLWDDCDDPSEATYRPMLRISLY